MIPAGGWITVSGDYKDYSVAVKWADGRDFDQTNIEHGATPPN